MACRIGSYYTNSDNPKKKVIVTVLISFTFAITILVYILLFPRYDKKILKGINVQAGSKTEDNYILITLMLKDTKIYPKNQIDLSHLGSDVYIYDIPILFFKKEIKVPVNIIDTTPPVITLNGDEVINISYKKEYTDEGAMAIDNLDGDVTSDMKISKEISNGNSEIYTYTVSDKSGNTSKKTRIVNKIDDVPPAITLNGNSRIYLELNSTYKEEGASATDEVDGDVTDKIKITNNVDTSKIGNYLVTYEVSDKSSNTSKSTREVIVGEKTNGSIIYLTFDDGPSLNITPKILDILKKKNIKATFFVLNFDDSKEYLIKRIIDEGHSIGIHGYSHNYKQIYASKDAFMSNVYTLQDKIFKITGIKSNIIRFPGGSSNTVSKFNPGIMSALTKEVLAKGFRYYDWNVSAEDAAGAKTPTAVYNNVVNYLKKNRSNVVLMHDFSGAKATSEALESIIDFGISNGYTFMPITFNTEPITHGVNN